MMKLVRTIKELRAIRNTIPPSKKVGFVPTMGYLHQGHAALVAKARKENDFVVASIFVNPAQFGPNEDLAKYPRDLERDMTILQAEGCDLLFNPDPAEMYAPNFRTWVALDGIDQTLEGKSRPGHFRGVATVVSKLFNMVQPNSSYFGQKDAIQCVVIKKMAEDLNFPVEVKIVDTLREADGLAMSSRNTYLSKEERPIAPVLYHALKAGESQFLAGVLSRDGIINEAIATIAAEKRVTLDYISLASLSTGEEIDQVTREHQGAILSGAVKLGKTRLIDNLIMRF